MPTKSFPNGIERRNASPVLVTGQDTTTATTARTIAVDAAGAVSTFSTAGDATIGTHNTDSAPTEVQMVGGKAVDPSALPADYTAGKIVQASHDLKGRTIVRSDTAAGFLTTEASGSSIKTAVEKVATEVSVGGGLLVRQPTAGNFNVTEASGASIKAAVEILDDVVATDRTDSPTEAAFVGGKATDATSLPADTTAGRITALLADLKGVLLSRNAYLAAGEDLTNDVQKVEQRFSVTDTLSADTQIKASAGFVHSVNICCTGVGGNNKIHLYDNTSAAGTPKYTWTFTAASNGPLPTVIVDASFGTGIYLDFDGATGNVTVTYR
jgi:hypothetical protein